MQYINGNWKNVEFTRNGNYLIVEDPLLEAGAGSFCVQLRKNEFVPVIIIAGCCVAAVVNVVLWAIIIKRKRAARKERSAEKSSKEKEKTSSK